MKRAAAVAIIWTLCTLPRVSLAYNVPTQTEAPEPWGSALQIAPELKYTQASMFGQGSVPTYKGFGYGVEIDYTIGTPSFSLGPYLSYVTSQTKNTASNSSQSEELDGNFTTIGLKLDSNITFLKIGVSQAHLTDKASGTINNSKDYKSTGVEVGAGLGYAYSENVSIGLGLDINYFKFDPNSNPIAERLDYFSYGLVLDVCFTIPSSSKSH